MMRKPIFLAVALGVCLGFGGAQAADQGARHHAQGEYDSVTATYVVVEGDDLIAISERFELPLDALKTHNKLSSDEIKAGDKLAIATAGVEAIPSASSTEELDYRQAFQRGTQAMIWGMPAVSMMGVRHGSERDLGATYNDIMYMSHPMVSRHGFLTANNQVPYVLSMLNTTDGPVVVEVPPASEKTIFFGSVIDAWEVPVTDMGPPGADAGKGGKYLFLPPGYDKPVPEGYLVFRPETFHTYLGLRPIAVNGGTLEEGVAYSKRLKAYPLASPDKIGRYIDAFPKKWDTLPKYDISFFQDLATVVDEEPVQAKDLAMMGMLSSIGIKKGSSFKPNEQTTKALNAALKLGYAQMQNYFTTPGRALKPFWPDHDWQVLDLPKAQMEAGFPYVNADELLIDARAGGVYFWATWLPKHLGKGSF